MKNKKVKIISIFITNLILIILTTTQSLAALTELQEKSTDLNHDGKRDIKDLDLIVSQPFPKRVNDGVEPAEGANVSYIFRNNFRKATTSSSLLEVAKDYVNIFEGSTPISEDGTKYQINGDLGVGHGIDIDNGGYTDRFVQAGYTVAAGEWVDVDFVDELEKETIEEKYQTILDKTAGINLTEYQIIALISRAYNCGESGAVDTVRGGKNFVQAYNAYWSDSKTKQYYGQSSDTNIFNEQLYTTYMHEPVTGEDINGSGAIVYYAGLERRRKSEWLLFATGYFDELGTQWSEDKSSSSSHSSGDIATTAIKIHSHMETNQYAYACVHNVNAGYSNSCTCNGSSCFAKNLTSSTVSEWYNIRCMDCSAYVSWVLFESGIDVGRQSSYFFYNGGYSGYPQYKWTKMTDWNQLEAGDILVSSGHVGIYIGDGKSSGAGWTPYIRSKYECTSLAGIRNMYSFYVRVSK